VYALDLHPQPPPEFLHTVSNTPNLHYCPADVRSAPQLADTLRTIADAEGRIDGMIASAGVLEEVPALECTKEQFQRIIDINVTGVFLSAQACAREMVRLRTSRGGSIALVASMSGVVANHVPPSSLPLHCG
jgi:NAD(P)-dependent dehydrogenase (short-subunit alcohol dehydrogenase family)